MKLEHLLLGVLMHQPSTGYDIKRYLDAQGRFLRPRTQMSQIYRCLTAIHDRGWVYYDEHERPGAQNAKVYSVTSAGSEVFLTWLTSPYHPPSPYYDHEFNARLSFCGFMGRDQFLKFLDREVVIRKAQVKRSRYRDRSYPRHPSVPFDSELADIVGEAAHQHGADGMDRHIEWVEGLAAAIRAGADFEHTTSAGHSQFTSRRD